MPNHRNISARVYFAYGGLCLLFAIAACVHIRCSVVLIDDLIHGRGKAAVPITVDDPWPEIEDLRQEASSAGLKKGDQILKVNGKTFAGMSDLWVAMRSARA